MTTTPTTRTIEEQMAVYESQREKLEQNHMAKWVVIHDGELQGVYETTDEANNVAQPLFQRGPCVIFRIGSLKTPSQCPYVGLV